MAIAFRRARQPAVATFADVARALPSGWTGAVHAWAECGDAVVYLFEGGIYSARISSFEPAVARRLASSGSITPAQADSWNASIAGGGDPEVHALEQGWCSLDQLNLVHQEYVLAIVGAVAAADDLHFESVAGEVTSANCCLPLPVGDLLHATAKRAERLRSEAQSLATTVGVDIEGDVVSSIASFPWQHHTREHGAGRHVDTPELRSLVEAFATARTLDGAAGMCGFTRAEAMHLAGLAFAAGLIVSAPESSLPGSFATQIDVPEAWPPRT